MQCGGLPCGAGLVLAVFVGCARSSAVGSYTSVVGSASAGRAPDELQPFAPDSSSTTAESTDDGGILAPGQYLVAIDSPTRTYLDFVVLSQRGRWLPEVDGWPLLARWDQATTATAVRFKSFAPGRVLSEADIHALLPASAPAQHTIDVTAAPYLARPSPADATPAIQAALDDARRLARPGHPVDVLIPAGTYDHDAVLEVASDVRLRGGGGLLRATHPATSAIHLAGDRSGALFLGVSSLSSARRDTPESCGIWVGPRSALGPSVHDTLVIGNDISDTSGAQVFGVAEDGGLWAFNHAHDGFADAFHHTGASRYCQVVANRASGFGNRGDDLYAFVGYQRDGDPVHHCSCVANWGRNGLARGLAAVGAGFIAFEHNDIAQIQWAGIYVARESSYNTYGSFSIAILDNRISFANLSGTHDGLLAYADAPDGRSASRTFGDVPNGIRDLVIKRNVFANTSAGRGGGLGIEVRSSCANGEVSGNTVTGAAAPGIVVVGAGYRVSANAVAGGSLP